MNFCAFVLLFFYIQYITITDNRDFNKKKKQCHTVWRGYISNGNDGESCDTVFCNAELIYWS